MANHIVNDLIEALTNAPGEKRDPARVGRLLAYCQQRCPEWVRGCSRYDREEWIALMITPGQRCSHRTLEPAD